MNLIWILIAGGSLFLCAGAVVLTLHNRRKNARIRADLDAMRADFNALCAGAVGVDKRVLRLEQRGRDLTQRQDEMEQQRSSTGRPYGEAIQLVQKGANAARLVEELDLTRNEAELIVMLHGIKDAG